MTDNEIIKALECCTDGTGKGIIKAALDLINRQKAEIERLQQENFDMSLTVEIWKTEAVKEFAERLLRIAGYENGKFIIDSDYFSYLEKEMVGDTE